jgi:hypothetical protein
MPRAKLLQGHLELERMAPEAAEQLLAEALHDPVLGQEAEAWRARGDALLLQGRNGDAELAYRRAVELPGEETRLRQRLGWLERSRSWERPAQLRAWRRCARTIKGSMGDHLVSIPVRNRYCVAGGQGGFAGPSLELWDLEEGKRLLQYEGHSKVVTCLAEVSCD